MDSGHKKLSRARDMGYLKQQTSGRVQPFKPVIAETKNATNTSNVRRTVPPPVYRPQAKPLVLQPRMAGASQSKMKPVAPPPYRPPAMRNARQVNPANRRLIDIRSNEMARQPMAAHVSSNAPTPRALQTKKVAAAKLPTSDRKTAVAPSKAKPNHTVQMSGQNNPRPKPFQGRAGVADSGSRPTIAQHKHANHDVAGRPTASSGVIQRRLSDEDAKSLKIYVKNYMDGNPNLFLPWAQNQEMKTKVDLACVYMGTLAGAQRFIWVNELRPRKRAARKEARENREYLKQLQAETEKNKAAKFDKKDEKAPLNSDQKGAIQPITIDIGNTATNTKVTGAFPMETPNKFNLASDMMSQTQTTGTKRVGTNRVFHSSQGAGKAKAADGTTAFWYRVEGKNEIVLFAMGHHSGNTSYKLDWVATTDEVKKGGFEKGSTVTL